MLKVQLPLEVTLLFAVGLGVQHIDARVRSTTGGYIFTGVCVLTGGTPGQVPGHVWGYPWVGQGGIPQTRQGAPSQTGQGVTTQARQL